MTGRDFPSRARDTRSWAAVVVAIVDTIAVAAAVAVALKTDVRLDIVGTGAWLNLLAGTAFPLLAALMLRAGMDADSRPRHVSRLAWLFVGFGVLCATTIVLHVYADHALRHGAPAAVPAAWLSSWIWIGVPCGFMLILLLFPTGDLSGPRWRVVPVGIAIGYASLWLAIALAPGAMTDFEGEHANPLGWQSADVALRAIGVAGVGLLVAAAVATVVSLGWRYRCGDSEVRSQLRWLVVTVVVIAVTIALPVPQALSGVALGLNVIATVLLPVALGVALVRRDGLVLPRVLLYGLLSVLVIIAYLSVVAVADALFGARADRVAGLVAVGVVAVAAAPLQARLQRAVDRLVYGDRGDPYAALTDLGRRMADTPDDLLSEVVRAVAHALRCPYVAVVLAGETVPTASIGMPTTTDLVEPLVLRGHRVGVLVLSRRSAEEQYSDRDLILVRDMARHIAVAAHAAALTRDLRRSRELLVIAREEERRRIRRDLHDGLGPALAGIALGLDAARIGLKRNPDETATALTQLKHEVQSSVADVRRLVYDLRPPALDRLGLVPAVEEYAARLREGGAISVEVSASPLPPLPAAVEVAAYRIATEALTNVARHSGAKASSVSFRIDALGLRLEVDDDGIGLSSVRHWSNAGFGMSAMAERAAELGGSCSVDRRAEGGTSVIAVLPVRAAS